MMKDKSISLKKMFGSVTLVGVILFILFVNRQEMFESSFKTLPEQLSELLSQELNKPDTTQPPNDMSQISEPDNISGGTVSYSFAGKRSLSELIENYNSNRGNAEPRGNDEGLENAGDNEITEGKIPDLTIRLNGMDLESVAERLGYQLVASTQERIHGKIVTGSLIPISKQERARYSDRAREATGIQNYNRMVQVIASRLEIPRNQLRLYYLVPNDVEERFIRFQKREMANVSLKSDQIQLMIAQYTQNLDLELVNIIQK